jgi:hypothetical protein
MLFCLSICGPNPLTRSTGNKSTSKEGANNHNNSKPKHRLTILLGARVAGVDATADLGLVGTCKVILSFSVVLFLFSYCRSRLSALSLSVLLCPSLWGFQSCFLSCMTILNSLSSWLLKLIVSLGFVRTHTHAQANMGSLSLRLMVPLDDIRDLRVSPGKKSVMADETITIFLAQLHVNRVQATVEGKL